MQTQTSNTFYNAIMEAGIKDRPPMLAHGNYVQWKSRIKRYIDTKSNHELIHYCLTNPPYKLGWIDKEVPISEGSPITRTERFQETYKNVSQDIRDQLNVEAEVVQIILTGIYNDIYSTVDACPNACETNRGKLIVNSPQPIYDQEPSMVAEDDETSKDKEIDKLMALISLSFKKIYKPTNNNLRTSSNTSRANQDNSPRINRSTGNLGFNVIISSNLGILQGNVRNQKGKGCRLSQGKDAIVSPDAADSGTIFDAEPLKKVSTGDHYNVFAMESEHPKQSESVHDTHPIEQDTHNVIIYLLDMSYDGEEIDQNDDDNDLAEEQMKDKLSAHQETISMLSQEKKAQIKIYKTRKDKKLDKVIALENKVKVLDNIVYKTGQSVQTMNMLYNKCRTSFAKHKFIKKAQRVNPRLYDIGCYNDNLALMLAPESDDVIRLEKESRSKLSNLIRPFDYNKLNNLYDLFVPQRESCLNRDIFQKDQD
nr:hypothetical protein [Tanacetum cinerariifolium]